LAVPEIAKPFSPERPRREPGEFCTSVNEANWYERSLEWPQGKKHSPEQIVSLLQQLEVSEANGEMTGQACIESYEEDQESSRSAKHP
jgi:hypothetical protein